MEARLRSWWQKIKQHRVAIGVVAIVLIVVIVLIIIGYLFDWTGFNGYNKVTITHTISGTNAGTVTKTEEYQPGKGLWDWLQLLGVLAIPVVVGFGAVWFTTRQGKVAAAENKDNQRETALQAYIDKLSELLLHEKLRISKPENEVRKIARVRTLTVLPLLDGKRKSSVLKFLYESELIDKKQPVIDLSAADLRGAELFEAMLWGTDLHSANLTGAELSRCRLDQTNLKGAELANAHLNKTELTEANLQNADMSRATLQRAILHNANCQDANLREADLDSANLRGANLTLASLIGANLCFADLSGAILLDANLEGADLRKAILNDANLEGARLSNANVNVIQLNTTKSLLGATMPDGSIHP